MTQYYGLNNDLSRVMIYLLKTFRFKRVPFPLNRLSSIIQDNRIHFFTFYQCIEIWYTGIEYFT